MMQLPNPNILLASRGPNTQRAVADGLSNQSQLQQAPMRNQLLEQAVMQGEQGTERGGMNLDAQRQKQEAVNALTTMAELEQFMSAGDLGGGIAQLDQAMKAGKIDQQDFRVLAQSIQNPELYCKVKQAAIEKARVLGIGGQHIPAGLQEFNAMTKDLTPEERERARRIELGLDPRAVGSAAITTAKEDLTDVVAGSEKVIESAKASGKEGGKKGKKRGRAPSCGAMLKLLIQSRQMVS